MTKQLTIDRKRMILAQTAILAILALTATTTLSA
jgi:hypothetical protein